jgi:acyl-coenzyme A synthetase/AMP-(fatty) acid ligase
MGITYRGRRIKPKAYIVLKKGYLQSEDLSKDIQTSVKKSIAPYKYPRWIEFVKELPKTSTGKIMRYKLRD